jgi:flagellar biosynthesis chaperone FliJ
MSDDVNDQRLTNTRAKLRLLEEARVKLQQQPSGNARVDKLSLDSLQSQIKQLKEEIVLCEIRASDGEQPSPA